MNKNVIKIKINDVKKGTFVYKYSSKKIYFIIDINNYNFNSKFITFFSLELQAIVEAHYLLNEYFYELNL